MFLLRPLTILLFFKPKFSFLIFITFVFVITSFNFYHRYVIDFGLSNIELYIFLTIICFLTINIIYLFSIQTNKIFKISSIFTIFILVLFIYDNPQIIDFYIHKLNFIKRYYHSQIFYNYISNVFSLNPYSKISFYISNGLFLNLSLVFLSSLILIKFLIQILLSFVNLDFKFQQNTQLFFAIFFVLSVYCFSNIPMDIRVFLSCLTPFFIYFNEKLLRKFYLITINMTLILASYVASLI